MQLQQLHPQICRHFFLPGCPWTSAPFHSCDLIYLPPHQAIIINNPCLFCSHSWLFHRCISWRNPRLYDRYIIWCRQFSHHRTSLRCDQTKPKRCQWQCPTVILVHQPSQCCCSHTYRSFCWWGASDLETFVWIGWTCPTWGWVKPTDDFYMGLYDHCAFISSPTFRTEAHSLSGLIRLPHEHCKSPLNQSNLSYHTYDFLRCPWSCGFPPRCVVIPWYHHHVCSNPSSLSMFDGSICTLPVVVHRQLRSSFSARSGTPGSNTKSLFHLQMIPRKGHTNASNWISWNLVTRMHWHRKNISQSKRVHLDKTPQCRRFVLHSYSIGSFNLDICMMAGDVWRSSAVWRVPNRHVSCWFLFLQQPIVDMLSRPLHWIWASGRQAHFSLSG